MMSSRLRFIWSTISRIKVNYISKTLSRKYVIPARNLAVPYALGFSIFTWLGFEEKKKLSAEDELIQTIKHCVLFIQRTEYEKAEQLLHIALRQAQQLHHQLGITYIYDVMANLALEREQLEKAKKLFVSVSQRVMADGATEDDSRVVHISIKLARISHLQKEYTTAQLGYDWCLEKLNKAFSKEPTDGLKKLIALTEDWYGRLFLDCGRSDQALKLMIKALEHMREVEDVEPEHLAIQINDIGTVCNQLGQYDESIQYFKQAIEMAKKLNMPDLGAMHVNLGRAYLKKNMLAEARKSCGFGWRLGQDVKDKDIISQAESCLHEVKQLE